MIHGTFSKQFAPLAEKFALGFEQECELGAALSVFIGDKPMVDTWGGYRDLERRTCWTEHTIVCMMSLNKAFAALIVHLLADRGEVDLTRPVAHYWPEFAEAGKAAITVDDLISHRAGLVYTDRAPPGAMFDETRMATVLARLPCDREYAGIGAYHSATYGILLSELVYRVTDRTISHIFRSDIAEPHAIDYHFSIDDKIDARVADIYVNHANPTIAMLRDPQSAAARVWAAQPGVTDLYNDPQVRRRGFASGAGLGNARAVARLMALIGQGVILSHRQLSVMNAVSWEGCALTGRPYRMARGMMRNSPPAMPMGPSPAAFGHAGAGGSIAFHDPTTKLSFAYSPNLMAAGEGVGAQCATLIEAAYECLN